MTELEKAIAGLESCRPGRYCGECPYQELYYQGDCNNQLEADALAVLKAMVPRVMTTVEVIDNSDWMWCEYRDGFVGWQYKIDYDAESDRVEWLEGSTDGIEDCGKTWRCWTARPTEEQMAGTPWEGGEADG